MKLSFSIRGWRGLGFDDFADIAVRTGVEGIELHNIRNEHFRRGGAFYDYRAAASSRSLYEKHIRIPCIDVITDISDPSVMEDAVSETRKCLEIASYLNIPSIRLRARDKEDREEGISSLRVFLDTVLPEAEKEGKTLLLETAGLLSDSSVLRGVLELYASDSLAALWNLSGAYSVSQESPESVITNLGAYVRHVTFSDFSFEDGKIVHNLAGEGILPVDDIMKALRSVNYDGFISMVWDPQWLPELDDLEMILSHFVSFIRKYGDTKKNEKVLYHNRTHTGTFVWKKELLIEETFPKVLDRMVEEYPDQYAFKYTTLDYTRTYSEFRDDVDSFAAALIALGVGPGTHVAVWASNVPQWYISFWAVTKIGAVLVSMNTAYKIHEAEYLLKQSDTHTLIITEGSRDISYGGIISELCPELRDRKEGEALHAKRLPFLRNVITVGFSIPGGLDWDEAAAMSSRVPKREVERLAAAVDKDDVCNMQYTSGTTGFPKGVMLTHYNVVNNGKCIGDRMDLSTADRMMIQVPMFHCFGMVLAMTAAMTHGVSLMPLPYFSTKPALDCIHNEHITCFHGVPTMFISMLSHPDFEKTDFSYMRTGIMAGSPCPVSVMQDVVDRMNMKEITIVYGQTEASPGCTMSLSDDPLEVRVATVGRPLPEIECGIMDPETGEWCPDNVIGEFVARGYNIMKGYYKMPTATSQAIDADGWLHTGDLALRREDGNYVITGRLKDMIIRGGENIYPKEIEEFIYTHPAVSDVQVVGVPDKQYGEEVLAAIILKEGMSVTEQEMKDFISASLARHKVPRYIMFVDSFPMNVAGKILKYKIREDAAAALGLSGRD